MPSVRSSGFLPALKCSTCGEEVEIALMGDHVCAPPKPTAATIPESSERSPDSPDSQKSLGSPISTRGAFFTKQKNGPPRIDAQGANRPFFNKLPENTSRQQELFIDPPQDGPMRPMRQDSLSPPPVPRRGDMGRMIDSPLLYNDNPYSYQGDSPSNLQSGSPPAPSSLYPSPAFNSMYAPASPTVTGGKNVMSRMNAMAPGPFGMNPQPSPLFQRSDSSLGEYQAFDRRPANNSAVSPVMPEPQQQQQQPIVTMGHQRKTTQDSPLSKRRPSQSSVHSHRSRSIGSEGRRRLEEDIPEVPSIDYRMEEDRRREEDERREREIEEERKREADYERGRQQMLQQEREEEERVRSEERERGRRVERQQELERQASIQRQASSSRSLSISSRRPSTASSRRGSNSPNDLRNGSPPTGPLPRPGMPKLPIGLPRRPSDKNSPAMMHHRQKSSIASINKKLPLQPLPSPKYPERSQSQGRLQEPRRPSITQRPGTSAGPRPEDELMPDFDRTQFPSNLLPPSRPLAQANAHHSISASSDSSSSASRASTAPSDVSSTPNTDSMHKKKSSTDSIKDDIDKLMNDLKVAVDPQGLVPTPRTPTFPVSPGKYQAYQAYNPKSPRPAASTRGRSPLPSPRPGAMARSFTTPNIGAPPPAKKAQPAKAPCRACNLPISGKGLTSSDGRLTGRYHKDCFVCQTCRSPFQSSTFYVYDNLPYCQRHYHTLNNSLCPTCDRGIEGPCLETEDRIRYHPNCFLCGDCGVGLGDEYWVVGKGAFCRQHAELRARGHRGPGGRGMPRGRGGPMGPGGRGGYGPRGGPMGPGMNGGGNNFMAPPVEKMERRRTRLMMM